MLDARANLARPAVNVADRFLFGAPVFAPLLFADLAALGAIAVWATRRAAPHACRTGPAETMKHPALDEPPRRVGVEPSAMRAD